MGKLKYAIVGLLIGAGTLFFFYQNSSNKDVSVDADVVIEQIKAVNKIVVAEGLFSEIYTYKDATNLYNLVPLEKKMILLVKGKASVVYDLELMDYKVDDATKTITVINRPAPEIKIEPEVKYYDVQDYMLYSFSTADYNIISNAAVNKLRKKIEASELQQIANKQLKASLNQIQWVGKTLGWKVEIPKT